MIKKADFIVCFLLFASLAIMTQNNELKTALHFNLLARITAG